MQTHFMRPLFIIVLTLLYGVLLVSCKKYLDKNPSKTMIVPSTLEDAKMILSNQTYLNTRSCGAREGAADDYYLTTSRFNGRQAADKLQYTWDAKSDASQNWIGAYETVMYANAALDIIAGIKPGANQQSLWNTLKGAALFFRSSMFWEIAQVYAAPYGGSNQQLGIPLRLTSELSVPTTRSTVEETYQRIVSDLETAAQLLPEMPEHVTQPGKAAAYGALARVYLSMRQYDKALEYADKCLSIYHELLDFAALDTNSSSPISRYNAEVIFHSYREGSLTSYSPTGARVDSLLVGSYAEGDLRRKIYFNKNSDGSYWMKTGFAGFYYQIFTGLATSEIYFIRAECHAREGHVDEAMDDLQTVLEKRWVGNTPIIPPVNTAEEALDLILLERRKDLVNRGLRWTDIRRLNLEGYNISLKRVLPGLSPEEYTLPANDPRFVFLVPQSVIDITGIQQNPR